MHKGRIRWKPAAAAGAVGQVDVGCRATAGLPLLTVSVWDPNRAVMGHDGLWAALHDRLFFITGTLQQSPIALQSTESI